MSPIPFGTPPYELTLPSIDINLLGSVILTVWELVNQNQLLVTMFILILCASAVGWLYNFVMRRKSADIEVNLRDMFEE
jgi:hypothetical protein